MSTMRHCYANEFVYDDRRRLTGDPSGRTTHGQLERIFEQYSQFDWRTLAVRGARLHLDWSRWADDAGNETGYLHRAAKSAMTAASYMTLGSTRTTSTPPTASSKNATTPAKARRTPKRALITDVTIAYNEAISTSCSAISRRRNASRESVTFGLPCSLGRRISCQRRGTQPHGPLVANMEFGHLLDVAELLRRSP